jgi:uncharacterized protein
MSLKIRQKKCLNETIAYVKEWFQNETSGHDWWHINRVRLLALSIAETEGGDLFLIEMAALLHDLDDWKLNENSKFFKTRNWLDDLDLTEPEKEKIIEIIDQVSFKGAGVPTVARSLEAKIVQDADRLDAIGAIGIARTFAFGGKKGRLMYHPEMKPNWHKSFEDYKNAVSPTINHFYEKLLLLKDRLNTDTAKEMAESRHRYMEDFLDRFFKEWECEI